MNTFLYHNLGLKKLTALLCLNIILFIKGLPEQNENIRYIETRKDQKEKIVNISLYSYHFGIVLYCHLP